MTSFLSLRFVKVAEPNGKRPLDIPKGGACSTKWPQESIVLLLSSARRKKQRYILLFILWRRERTKRHPPNPSPSLYGRGVTDYGGKPPYVRGLVWLTKPVPLRGEPWSFYRLRRIIYYHTNTPGVGRGG